MSAGAARRGGSAPGLVLGALEVALNRYLALEPEVLAECAALSGRTIALALDAPAWTITLELGAQGVRALAEPDRPADVTVSGPLPLLSRLALRAGEGGAGLPQGLVVDGDAELLTRFNRMLARVGFDPEELAARLIGDGAAHRLGQGLRQAFDWGRRTAATLGLDTAEYLREETRDLARAADVADWMDGVDALRDGVERCAARLDRLEARRP